MLAIACGPATPPSVVTGVVIAADGPNAAQVDRFTLRTQDGQTLEFVVGRLELYDGGLPAAHLREHLVSGEPIDVQYREDTGQKVVVRYTDAAE